MALGSFQGLRVLAFESRRAAEIATLIRTHGGKPTVTPAMREIPLQSNHEAIEFAARLLHGDFDLVIFLTGVGIRRLMDIVETSYERDRIIDALRRVKVAARGPKPSAVLRELGVPIAVTAPEPCTWREMIGALDAAFGPAIEGLRAAIQEYGSTNPELLSSLTEHGVQWTRVPVYRWALPDDLEPLRNSVRSVVAGELDVIIFLTAVQVIHLFQVAEEVGSADALRARMRDMVVLSIGPSTSKELENHGIQPDFEPSHPRMGFLISEASACALNLLEKKRGPLGRNILDGSINVSAEMTAPVQATTEDAAPIPAGEASPTPAPSPKVVPEIRRETDPVPQQGTEQSKMMELMHAIGRRMAASDPLHAVLNQIVTFIDTLLRCDSCFVYVLEETQLMLRASKNPHPDIIDHLGLRIGEGITGWVAEHQEPVAIDADALRDPRFQVFKDLPEDSFEAFLSVPIVAHGRLVGVINVQHRRPHHYTPWEVQTISMVGFLMGAQIEMARLESENSVLSGQLATRKLVERAKGMLQRELRIDEDQAYHLMQRESRQRRKNMREIAEAIILSAELRRATT